jgi:multidrug efflux system membrane fusion protein
VQAQTGRGRTLAVEAWDHDLRRKLATGTLLTTDNEVDPATATVKLKALFENRDDALFPNQFVNARLLVDTLHDVVIVPAAAVQRGAQSTFVWVVGANGAAEMKPCTVGRVEGDQAALASGVTAGEAVVVDGVDRLQQGTKVAAQPPPGGRPGAGRPSGAGR